MSKRVISKKVYIAIILLVILAVATAAVIYATQISTNKTGGEAKVGVHVGDTFTYKLRGESILGSVDAVTPDYFSMYNDTDYYQVVIAGINGTQISLVTQWKFINGTQITNSQTIDLSSGNTTGQNPFWAIYPSNLNVNNLLRPKGTDGITVNATDTKTYADSTRTRNFWQIDSVFTDVTDPTGITQRDDYIGVYFDKQTGMLDTLTNIQRFNNPQYNLVVTWQLAGSSVWVVQ